MDSICDHDKRYTFSIIGDPRAAGDTKQVATCSDCKATKEFYFDDLQNSNKCDCETTSFDTTKGQVCGKHGVVFTLEDYGDALYNNEIGEGWSATETIKYQKGDRTSMLALAGTVVGFGAFGYAIVKLTQKEWKEGLMYAAGGALVLTAVGWKLREVFNAPSTPHNYMKRADVEKILDESAGKIVGVTFIKKDGSERTLVGRIGKRYTPPPGFYPQHSKSARRGRGHFTIYDMQKGAFRLINMDTVIGIRAEGTSHTA